MFKNEIENCKKLKPKRHLNLLIGIKIVISKKICDLNKRKMIYVSVDGWGFVIPVYRIWIAGILECFKEFFLIKKKT